ncbi:uncharacterized protein KD926_005642 [Aspergillus affinis]|uniref:uncharacterized protein n=1 Tax=Aspergillus affinis TaxID=1070780 RepID=UPI0022FE5237|nr:uncharacterized protein KD926_005642 [Aspergillus affinis]KAI9042347.1 hypothetical protein KD926_005642 [Aspergillus affinis]
MVYIESGMLVPQSDDEYHDGYYLTQESTFSQLTGLEDRDVRGKNAYPIHEACWNILKTVHGSMVSDEREINLQELIFVIKEIISLSQTGRPCWDCDGCIVAEQFQVWNTWEPVKSYERLVTDPGMIDFELFVSECFGREHPGIRGLRTAGTAVTRDEDPVERLPMELRCMVLQLLPSQDVLALATASPAFKSSASDLPRSFWKSRMLLQMPWLLPVWPELNRILKQATRPVKYKKLLRKLRYHSMKLQTPDLLYDDYRNQWRKIGLQNLRRIWMCCEEIVENVEANSVVSIVGRIPISPALRSRTFQKVITPYVGDMQAYEEEAETFFITDIHQEPEIRSITVYFKPETTTIAGIEFAVNGKRSPRLLGRRFPPLQSVAFPPGAKIHGFSLYTERYRVRRHGNIRRICGLGIITDDSPFEPRLKLGSWSHTGEIFLYRLEGIATTHQHWSVVGMCGHFMNGTITGFGFMTADLSKGGAPRGKTTKSPPKLPDSEIHYTQTKYKAYWADYPEDGETEEQDPDNPRLPPLPLPRKVWTVFVDLSNSDIFEIQAMFDLDPQITCRRLEFFFADGSQKVVACCGESDYRVRPKPHIFRLNPGEKIIGSDIWQSATLGQHRFRFFTSYDRVLHLAKPKRELKFDSPNDKVLKWKCPENKSIVGMNFHVENAGILSVFPVFGRRVEDEAE